MRVLHVITALGVGGAEGMLLKLLGARALAGVEQQVLAMLPGGAMAQPLRATGAKVEELDFLGGLPVIGGALRLARLARCFRPDLVQGWMYHGNLGAALAHTALGRSVPLVWGVRQSLPSLAGENRFARIGIRLNKAASSWPDRLLFNSQTGLRQHRDFGFDMRRAQYLPNGFDTASFAPDAAARARCRAAWGADAGTVVFGLLARHHPTKDHAGFIRAAGRVHAQRGQVLFVLAGTAVDEGNAALVRAIAEAGLADRMRLLGPQSDVASVLAGLDVYVSSSRAEAFSNALGEAMSCGLPGVVTDVGDSGHVLGAAGRVVPPGDAAALAGAMIELVDVGPPGRAEMGARARQRIVAEFDIEAVAGRYAGLYDELVGRARQAH